MKKARVISMILVVALLISALCVFTACGGDKNATTDEGELTKVTFLLDWAPNTNHTGLYVAKNLGYFKDAGLDVKFVQPGTTGTSGSVAGGNAEFGIDFQEQMIFHEQNKVNVTAIAAIMQHNTSGIVSKAEKNIKKPLDLEGKTYATWGLAGEQTVMKGIIRDAGGNAEKLSMKESTIMNIIAEFNNPNSIFDAVWSFAAWDKINLDQNNIANNFIYLKDVNPALDFYTPVIVANNDYMAKNPDKVRAFVAAASKGYNYAVENPIKAAEIMMNENPELKVNEKLVKASQEYLAGQYVDKGVQWGYIDGARWDSFFDYITKNRDLVPDALIPEKITKGFGFTNDYLPAK